MPPLLINLSGIQHVTGLVIRYVSNDDYWYYSNYLLYYDDFTFTPELTSNITNPRVSGGLDQTTKSALLGAKISLQSTTSQSGGTYSWSFTGPPYSIVSGSQSSSSITIRPINTGTMTAKLTYTLNGTSVSPSVNINVVLPTLTSFWATQSASQLNRDRDCSEAGAGATFTLGCYRGPTETPGGDGIIWRATAQIPQGSYLSDPAESGIKFVQSVSAYRKRLIDGNIQCFTARTAQSAGWQLDSGDPYDSATNHYFSEGNTLDMNDFDDPGGLIENEYVSDDAQFVDNQFETYVFYFTTDATNHDPGHPILQRVLNLSGSTYPVASLRWSWHDQAVFNYFSTPPSLLYTRQSNTPAGSIYASETEFTEPLAATNLLTAQPCPGTTVTSNPIDGSKFYIAKMYLDFLGRAADQDGWNFWRSNITPCAFDMTCVANKRIDVARAFFYSTEFMGLHPDLRGQRGTHDYNTGFVYACYRGFLRREPNAPPDNNWNGFNFWVAKLDSTNPDAGDGKYNEMLKAFLESIEYRGRFGQP
jgi:hypothetical protein